MSEFNMRMDLAPYTPDLFIKDKIYQSLDKVDYTSYISINSTIFVFNIKCETIEESYYYDSPDYLLYGIPKSPPTPPPISPPYVYTLPSTFFFNFYASAVQRKPYEIINQSRVLTIPIRTLIGQIGYDINLIEEKNFYYAELDCTDVSFNLTTKKRIIYLFFTQKDPNADITNNGEITNNYNNYNSTVFYEGKYRNVYIYPYINIPSVSERIFGLGRNFGNSIFSIVQPTGDIDKNIEPIDFDDRDIIKYYEKIDYKYMEREEYYINQNNKVELLKYLQKNYENFEDYYLKSLNSGSIMISCNEISMVYFNNLDYEISNENSYTLKNLNNQYINTNTSYSGKDKCYSFSLDNKLSYVKKYIDNTKFRYNPYDSTILNIPSIYQMTKNYYVNGYVDILNYNEKDSNNLLFTINSYLYKTFLIVNPFILNSQYLTSSQVILSINNIFSDNNNLVFGFGIDKVRLYFKGTPRFTNTYYINKYKINFKFNLTSTQIVNYIVILGICFYNGSNISLLRYDTTKNTDDLGYVLFTNQDCTLSLNTHIYNSNERINIFEQKEIFLYDIKRSNFSLSFLNKNLSSNENYYDDFLLTNFYTYLPNMNRIKLNETNIYISNYQNITVNKLNNFIKNFINININYYVFKNNSYKSKTLITYDLLFDLNLENTEDNLVYNFTYFPNVLQYDYMPLNIEIYKVYTRFPQILENLVTLPAGFYKVFRYTNYFPLHDFSVRNTENDQIVLTVNSINGFLQNNFCLLVKLPNGSYVEDDLFVKLSESGNQDYYSKSNFMCNMGNNNSEIYLVVSDSNGKLYQSTNNVIYGYKLFDQYNSYIDQSIVDSKYKIKLLAYTSSYLNFYQIVFNILLFNDYFEKNSLLVELQKIEMKTHNIEKLKDVVYYDFIRFNYITNLSNIITQYKNYDIKLAINLNNLKQTDLLMQNIINNLIYIFNTNKIIITTKKIYSYLTLVKNYQIQKNYEYDFLIAIINYCAKECLNTTFVNYNLDTNYCINNNEIQELYGFLSVMVKSTTLKKVINILARTYTAINYFESKVLFTIKDTYELLEKLFEINISNNEIILKFIEESKNILENYTLNLVLINNVEINIDKQENDTLFNFFTSMFPNYTQVQIKILITTLINLVKIRFYNSSKLDELINTLRLIYFEKTLDGLFPIPINNVVKNNFIYNPIYYNINLRIKNFDFNKFLFDLFTVINYFSDPDNSDEVSSKLYKKVIDENIVGILSTTGNLFNSICKNIIGIYKFENDIDTGIIPKYDIYNEKNIGNMYYLLSSFKLSLTNLQKIIVENGLLLFTEFDPVIKIMLNFISSVSEYLYFVQIVLIFRQFNEYVFIGDINYIPEDILKILTIEEVYKIFKFIIDNFVTMIQGKNQSTINTILSNEEDNNRILRNPDVELKKFTDIVKKYKFGTTNVYNILKSYILESYVIVNEEKDFSKIIDKLDLLSENVIILQDLNILYDSFQFSSFNFDKKILELINNYNTYKIYTLDYYYKTPDIEFYKQLINYNFLEYGFYNNLFQDT